MIGRIVDGEFLLTEEELAALAPKPRRPHRYREELRRANPIAQQYNIVCKINRCTEPGIWALGDVNWYDEPVLEYEFLRGRWFCQLHFHWVERAVSEFTVGKWGSGAWLSIESLHRSLEYHRFGWHLGLPCGHAAESDGKGQLKPCRWCV